LVCGRIVADSVPKSAKVCIHKLFSVRKVRCYGSLLSSGIELVGWSWPICVPMNALGNRDDDHDRQEDGAADHDYYDGS
jgi:hypothetical protein